MKFTRSEMKEIRYASLLHDFGKVGVREEVLTKARKLYPGADGRDLQPLRFCAGGTLQAESGERKLAVPAGKRPRRVSRALPQFDRELAEQLGELDRYAEFIRISNEPSLLPRGTSMFAEMAERKFCRPDGVDARW